MLTGEPVETMEEGKHYGEGICPNCAEPAKPYDADAVRQASIREQIKALQADLKGDS
jgi:protein-arginine kinase activator protein McsA